MSIHLFQYGRAVAPLGYVLCYVAESIAVGYCKIDETDPNAIIHCQDCDEPAVIINRISYDEGWQERYCVNCAWVHLDFKQSRNEVPE